MGMYNPDAPLIVGNQFAPTVTADYRPELFVERGWSFRQPATTFYDWASFFISELPPTPGFGHTYLWTLYRRGQETNTGPARTVLIPVSEATLTNSTVQGTTADPVVALSSPTNAAWITLGSASDGNGRIRAAFDIAPYEDLLDGRRILDVSFRYIVQELIPRPVEAFTLSTIALRDNGLNATHPYDEYEIIQRLPTQTDTSRSRWGEIAFAWNRTHSPLSGYNVRYPWNFNQLMNFHTGEDLKFEFDQVISPVEGWTNNVHYLAMQVTFCEENRLAVFGAQFGSRSTVTDTAGGNAKYRLGQNSPSPGNIAHGFIDPQSLSQNGNSAAQQAGFIQDLTLTLKRADAGPANNSGTPPVIRALRTLEVYPGHPGVLIQNTLTEGQEPTAATTDLMPQLIINTIGAGIATAEDPPPPWLHVYGLITPLQVHILSSPTQEIVQLADAPSTEFPQLRFWARSLDASAPLEVWLDNQNQPDGVFVGQLTPSEWAALPEIADGWKQVTMLVDPAALIDDDGTVLTPSAPYWQSSTSQFRSWEVLAVRVNPDPYNPGAPEETGLGTYGDGGTIPTVLGTDADADESTTAATSYVAPSVTAPEANSLLICAWLTASTTGAHTIPGSMALGASTTSAFTRMTDATETVAAGATGTRTTTGPSDRWSALSFTVGNPAGAPVVEEFLSGVDTSADVTLTTGAGTQAGWVMVAIRGFVLDFEGTMQLLPPSGGGWTLQAISAPEGTGTSRCAVWTKIVRTAGAQSVTFPNEATSPDNHARLYVLSNVDTDLEPFQAQGGIIGDLPDTEDIDVAVFWGVAMPAIEGLAVAGEVQPLAAVDPGCVDIAGPIPTGIEYAALTWEPVTGGAEFIGLGHYEIQRRDDTMPADQWETIATPTHPLVDAFDDYEARIGIESSWRIRYVHEVGMAGPWSTPVTYTVPSPGVTGVRSNCARAVLTFTSNQAPHMNVAYSASWTGSVEERFDFVESGQQVLQTMHRRDYQVAFRPHERGGVTFGRMLLVSAAAITVERQRAGFEPLRDLAWDDDLPYVCVRDANADRWLANLLVSSGVIRARRRLYLADVQITEVADVPAPATPTVCEGLTSAGALPGTVYDQRYASTPGTAALDTDDIDIAVELRLDAIQTFPLVARYAPQLSDGWIFEAFDDGIGGQRLLWFVEIPFGVGGAYFESDPVPFAPGDRYWVRIEYLHDVGGAAVAQFHTSPDGAVWTPLATTMFDDVPIPTTPESPLPMTVGAVFDGTVHYDFFEFTGASGGWNGAIPHVIVEGDAGTIADVDFESEPSGTQHFEDAQGNPWHVDGGICG